MSSRLPARPFRTRRRRPPELRAFCAAVRSSRAALLFAACGLVGCSGGQPVRASRAFVVTLARAPAEIAATCPPAEEGPEGVRCRWRVATVDFSTGARRPAVEVCLCDACGDDGDCRARPGGRCVDAEAYRARTPASIKACAYPDEPCHAPCGEGRHCAWNRDEDRATCVVTPAPLPYQ